MKTYEVTIFVLGLPYNENNARVVTIEANSQKEAEEKAQKESYDKQYEELKKSLDKKYETLKSAYEEAYDALKEAQEKELSELK